MRKENLLLVVGALVFVTPFLGVPKDWVAFYLFVLGGLVMLVALSCRFSARRRNRRSTDHASVHVQHDPHQQTTAESS